MKQINNTDNVFKQWESKTKESVDKGCCRNLNLKKKSVWCDVLFVTQTLDEQLGNRWQDSQVNLTAAYQPKYI